MNNSWESLVSAAQVHSRHDSFSDRKGYELLLTRRFLLCVTCTHTHTPLHSTGGTCEYRRDSCPWPLKPTQNSHSQKQIQTNFIEVRYFYIFNLTRGSTCIYWEHVLRWINGAKHWLLHSCGSSSCCSLAHLPEWTWRRSGLSFSFWDSMSCRQNLLIFVLVFGSCALFAPVFHCIQFLISWTPRFRLLDNLAKHMKRIVRNWHIDVGCWKRFIDRERGLIIDGLVTMAFIFPKKLRSDFTIAKAESQDDKGTVEHKRHMQLFRNVIEFRFPFPFCFSSWNVRFIFPVFYLLICKLQSSSSS